MSAQHTPGPLKIAGRDTRSLPHTLVSARTLLFRVYSEAYGDVEQEQANARRLVACWNACNGVSTMDLEMDNSHFLAALQELSGFRAQRDAQKSAPMQVSTTTVLIGQIKVMAELLQASVGVLRTVDPESTEERELLQTLIDQSEAAIATVLTEHAMGGKAHG
jgi:hypothetical protein